MGILAGWEILAKSDGDQMQIPSTHQAAHEISVRYSDRAPRVGIVAVYVTVFASLLSPLLWTDVPVLIDYPNHLARMWILSGEHVSRSYVPEWKLIPNLAMDLIVPSLAKVLPLELAGRIFVAVSMILPAVGTIMIRRALWGRVGLTPLISGFFIYNSVLYWGFLNYLFGLGCALICFALWVMSARWTQIRRGITFGLLAALLFTLHLFALGVYGLLGLSYEIGRYPKSGGWSRDDWKTNIATIAQFVPATILWLIPSLFDQNLCAQSRSPMDMMVHG